MSEFAYKFIEGNFKKVVLVLSLFFIIDTLVLLEIGSGSTSGKLSLYFLPVGQGDSELAVLPGEAKILVDGGPPDALVLNDLDKILSPRDRYIDIVALSHEELDHFGGLIEVLKRYKVGIFVWNGVPKDTQAARDLERVIKEEKIPTVALAAGDSIRQEENEVKVLWPLLGAKEDKGSLNETALVLELESQGVRALYTGDIGTETEKRIVADNPDISDNIDILKVGHHGSKFSSSANLLDAIKPKVSVIEVGKNSYGHPTADALGRLADVGSEIFRTDKDGLLKFEPIAGALQIFKVP